MQDARQFFVAVVFVLSMGLAPAQLHAASEEACKAYSVDAVKKAKEASRLNCGKAFKGAFEGPVWSTDPNAHKSWCLGASEDSVEHETRERDNALETCGVCREYMQDAADLFEAIKALGCRPVGTSWPEDVEAHFRWCMGLADRRRLQSDALRKQDVARWRAFQKCKECRRYAGEAVIAAKQNRARRCHFDGPRWIKNENAHFEWCLEFGTDSANSEENARSTELNQCRLTKIQQGTQTVPGRRQTDATTKVIRQKIQQGTRTAPSQRQTEATTRAG